MGQVIAADIVTRKECVLAGGLVREPSKAVVGVLLSTKAEDIISASDVVIDFTTASAAAGFAQLVEQQRKAFVCGTTGLDATTLDVLKCASARIPVLYAPNTSLSLVAMKQITTLAAKLLGSFDYDVAVLDEHHRNKKDAPSGTALALGQAVESGSGGKKKPSYAAVRAGAIVGEHEVTFAGQGEIIRLRHSVTDRAIFARGAVDAALWLHGKKAGFYGMDDVLGLKD
jgi:4-hydroxy-tetrahydrodipicolinate reductase